MIQSPPAHVALRLVTVLPVAMVVVLLQACSSTPPNPNATYGTSTRSFTSRLTPYQAADVTLNAVSLVGTPYRRGGNTPENGFDCSGLIRYVYKASAGVNAPRTVAQLSDWGQAIPSDSVQTGDLVVFTLGGWPRTLASMWATAALSMHLQPVAKCGWTSWHPNTGPARRWHFAARKCRLDHAHPAGRRRYDDRRIGDGRPACRALCR